MDNKDLEKQIQDLCKRVSELEKKVNVITDEVLVDYDIEDSEENCDSCEEFECPYHKKDNK
jgi:hypothetical protein